MKRLATLTGAALALILQGAFAGAYAASSAAHCTGMTVTDSLSSDANDQTASTAWVNITDGRRSFAMTSEGCAIVTFSGLAGVVPAGNTEYLHIRTLLDDKAICTLATTNDTFFAAATQPTPASADSIARVCEHVTPGVHSVQVQFRGENGGVVQIAGHVLTVTHN